jgi:hypothetical protein
MLKQRRTSYFATALVIGSLFLGACGSDDNDGTTDDSTVDVVDTSPAASIGDSTPINDTAVTTEPAATETSVASPDTTIAA